MKIDGKLIAQQILNSLKQQIQKLHLHPTLSVILVGKSPASISYIKQKQKAAEFIGAKIIVKKFNNLTMEQCNNGTIIKTIEKFNKNPKVHGLIVQLPLPTHLNPEKILAHITPEKDVDGFNPDSPFTPPVASAVLKVLEVVVAHLRGEKSAGRRAGVPAAGGGNTSEVDVEELAAEQWQTKNFLIIGRGLTAGKPIAKTLKKLDYQVTVAHSQTPPDQLAKLVKLADVVISCVGKPNIVKAKDLKPGAIVIGVGIHREIIHLRGEKSAARRTGVPAAGGGNTSEVKLTTLVGDFNEEEVSKVASFYTPTPGGIGPLNVACLMENLVKASMSTWADNQPV